MAPTRNQQEPLARVNFPLYSLQMVTNRHVLVGGGGGAANSGVQNGFEIFEVSHDGKQYISQPVIRHLTGPSAVMNCASYNDGKHIYLVTGQESHSQLYNINTKVTETSNGTTNNIKAEQDNSTSNVRKRNKGSKDNKSTDSPNKTESDHSKEKPSNQKPNGSIDNNSNTKQLTFDIKPNDSIQTDFGKDDPIQKVVRISPAGGKLMATGGTDGHVRVWYFPQMTKKLDIAAHTKEVDDLDISPNGKHLVSLSKDNRVIMWSLDTGKQVQAFTWTVPEGSKYMYKRCRFAAIEGDVDRTRLFTLTNPIGKPGKLKSHLQLWEPHSGILKRMSPYSESLSALAVSDDGRFVAVGTMFSGSVSIHIAFSLQQVMTVKGAHHMFVTGLLFLPSTGEGPPVTSQSEATVMSISVDNKVCVHSLAYRHSVPVWVAVLMIVAALFLVFVLCSYVGI